MNKNRVWVIGVILAAAAGLLVLQTGLPSKQDNESPASTTTPTYEGCAYMWATHDSPEITARLNRAIREINPKADANAALYGEDCVYQDGHSTFSTMETDFHVRLVVIDLKDEEAFGNWMAGVMAVITAIPREDLPGNYGFVEFWFTSPAGDQLTVRVPVQEYLDQARGLSGKELLHLFQEPRSTPASP